MISTFESGHMNIHPVRDSWSLARYYIYIYIYMLSTFESELRRPENKLT
jgi:hypothetical protein